MFCTNCGQPLPENAHFCSCCGSTLHNATDLYQTQAQSTFKSAQIPPISPAKPKQAGDPSLTKNIIQLFFIALFIFSGWLGLSTGDTPSAVVVLLVSAAIAFFTIIPSSDHIDTSGMTLLKRLEHAVLPFVYFALVFAVETQGRIFICNIFALFFSVWFVLRIKLIPVSEQTSLEKILLALNLILTVICVIVFLVTLFGLLFAHIL